MTRYSPGPVAVLGLLLLLAGTAYGAVELIQRLRFESRARQVDAALVDFASATHFREKQEGGIVAVKPGETGSDSFVLLEEARTVSGVRSWRLVPQSSATDAVWTDPGGPWFRIELSQRRGILLEAPTLHYSYNAPDSLRDRFEVFLDRVGMFYLRIPLP